MSRATREAPAASALGEAPAALRPDDSFRRAAGAAMWPQVARLLELEPALVDPGAIDALKRYRVATRRLRAALRVFGSALPGRAVRGVEPELGEVARAVGSVRDLDVRLAGLQAWATGANRANGTAATARTAAIGPTGGMAEVAPLRLAWAAERSEAAAAMERRLATRRHGRLLADLIELVADAAADEQPARDKRTVRDRAGSATWAAFERLRARAGDIGGADPTTLHDLRIRAKRLRYTLEFLAPALGADREWLVARLVDLQDHLGALHDADLAAEATRRFLADDAAAGLTGGERTAIAAYAEAEDVTVARLRRDVSRAAGPVTAPAFARRLARAILGPAESA